MNIPISKFEDYLKNKNLKDRTIEGYIYYFNKFTDDVFNQETVSRFLSLSPNRNTVGRSFLLNYKKFLLMNHKEFGLTPHVRANIADIELPKLTGRIKQRIIKPIPHDQIVLLENCLESESLKLRLILSYYCGLRLGELLKIKIVSFNWDEWKKEPQKMGECRVFGKGDKEGIALVPSKIMYRVADFIHSQDYPSVDHYLFINPKQENVKLRNLARTWQTNLAKAGIDSGITQLDSNKEPIKDTVVHPHRLRHSYGYYLLSKGVDIRKIQKLLRHADISSTQIYTHVSQEELKKELSDIWT